MGKNSIQNIKIKKSYKKIVTNLCHIIISYVPLKYFLYECNGVNPEGSVDDIEVLCTEHTIGHGKAEGGRNEATPVLHGPEWSCPLHCSGFSNRMEERVATLKYGGFSRAFFPIGVFTRDDSV